MIRLRLALLFAGALLAAPAAAQIPTTEILADDSVTDPQAQPLTAAERAVPAMLTPRQRYLYRRIFLDISNNRLSAAETALANMPNGPLHANAEAQLLLARGPSAGLIRLSRWVEANRSAPQASAIVALARRAGAQDLPAPATTRRLVPVSLTPPLQPRSARGERPADAQFAAAARNLISANRAPEVEALLDRDLTAEVRSEWAYRAGWDLYLDLDDQAARRFGARAADGSGDWAAMGNWVAGLASFRLNDCEAAARHFDAIGQQYTTAELRSGAALWAARAHVRCGRPQMATERLRSAVALDRTGFYGLLAARTLGITPNVEWAEPDFIQADWNMLSHRPGARVAAALAEIGQTALADRELRHLAATAEPELYEPILRLAARLDLPATQYWLAHNPPPGQMPPMSARLPAPDWRPFNGWRVDRNLLFAHAMQESRFITSAKSGAGAKGLLQLMPGTARDLARQAEMTHREDLLEDPAFNVEYGQSYLEMLRDSVHTQGLLPKVIAAYNAGPGSVQKWNAGGLKDNGDALLFMESIPFRETRHYVRVVLRNYWLYQLKAAAADPAANTASLDAMAANDWPRFPATPR